MFERAGRDSKKEITLSTMNLLEKVLSFTQDISYFDYKFDILESKIVIVQIWKKDLSLRLDQEIMLSLWDPIYNKYTLSYNQIEVDSKDWKKSDDWYFDCQTKDDALLKESWTQLFKSVKKGNKITITKDGKIMHVTQYINKNIIVRESSLVASTADIPEEDCEKFFSATEMYLCTWNLKILKQYLRYIYGIETKIKKLFCSEVESIEDYIILSSFFNILPKSNIYIDGLLENLDQEQISIGKIFTKRLKISESEATIHLSQNLVVTTDFKIKFRSMVVECKEIDINKSKRSWVFLRYPHIISLEWAQLCDNKVKNDSLIKELMQSMNRWDYYFVSIDIQVKSIVSLENLSILELGKFESINSLEWCSTIINNYSLNNMNEYELKKAVKIAHKATTCKFYIPYSAEQRISKNKLIDKNIKNIINCNSSSIIIGEIETSEALSTSKSKNVYKPAPKPKPKKYKHRKWARNDGYFIYGRKVNRYRFIHRSSDDELWSSESDSSDEFNASYYM